jgi:hypothetical protein
MKGLFIIIIVLVVLWFINQHTRNFEPFEINEEENENKVELSLCNLVYLIKKLLINKKGNMSELEPHVEQIRRELEPSVDQIMHDLEPNVEQIRRDLEPNVEQIRQDLEQSVNMNIINNVEPNDDDVYSNQSLFAQIDTL